MQTKRFLCWELCIYWRASIVHGEDTDANSSEKLAISCIILLIALKFMTWIKWNYSLLREGTRRNFNFKTIWCEMDFSEALIYLLNAFCFQLTTTHWLRKSSAKTNVLIKFLFKRGLLSSLLAITCWQTKNNRPAHANVYLPCRIFLHITLSFFLSTYSMIKCNAFLKIRLDWSKRYQMSRWRERRIL